MVRRSHVVQGSIACCPWWTLGGGALVTAAAVALSGAGTRSAEGAELDVRASRGIEVLPDERDGAEALDAAADDDERAEDARTPSAPSATQETTPAPRAPSAAPTVRASSFPESLSASRPAPEGARGSTLTDLHDAR